MAPKKKPLLDAYIRTEYGDVLAEGIHADPERIDGDITYVPGFSDLRVARDKQLGEVVAGNLDQKDVSVLPINLRWVRRSDSKGNPDPKNQVMTANMGYEPVNAETDVGQPWLTRLPEGAQVLPGGLIAKMDTVLMKCTAKRAAQNAAENFKRIVELGDLEFDSAEGVPHTGKNLSSMGGSVTKVKAEGPINIKDTGKLK